MGVNSDQRDTAVGEEKSYFLLWKKFKKSLNKTWVGNNNKVDDVNGQSALELNRQTDNGPSVNHVNVNVGFDSEKLRKILDANYVHEYGDLTEAEFRRHCFKNRVEPLIKSNEVLKKINDRFTLMGCYILNESMYKPTHLVSSEESKEAFEYTNSLINWMYWSRFLKSLTPVKNRFCLFLALFTPIYWFNVGYKFFTMNEVELEALERMSHCVLLYDKGVVVFPLPYTYGSSYTISDNSQIHYWEWKDLSVETYVGDTSLPDTDISPCPLSNCNVPHIHLFRKSCRKTNPVCLFLPRYKQLRDDLHTLSRHVTRLNHLP